MSRPCATAFTVGMTIGAAAYWLVEQLAIDALGVFADVVGELSDAIDGVWEPFLADDNLGNLEESQCWKL